MDVLVPAQLCDYKDGPEVDESEETAKNEVCMKVGVQFGPRVSIGSLLP